MKKGFTLIEILAVIVLMGILLTFLLPKLFSFSKKTESELFEQKIEKIKIEAREYGNDNIDSLKIEPKIITVGELVNYGYLDGNKNIKNPITNKDMSICEIEISYDGKKIYVEFIKNKMEENYDESCDRK